MGHASATDLLVTILDLIRFREANTRPELSRVTGLGRAIITQRVNELIDAGLVIDDDTHESTGGRPSRMLSLNSAAGSLFSVEFGATDVTVALTDLSGSIIESATQALDIAEGPDVVLAIAESIMDGLLKRHPKTALWGIGVGLPGPVEFSLGTPISPPIMPGWDRYPVRMRLSGRYNAPTWIDNDVNVLAIGEARRGVAQGVEDAIFIKVGTGIGAGLISEGHLHRGAQGAAGDIGHVRVGTTTTQVCRCGKVGCLESLAGGFAIAHQGLEAARDGSSHILATTLADTGIITAQSVAEAASRGDLVANEILGNAGRLIGETLATLINFFNPSLIIIGGGVSNSGDMFLAAIRQSIYERSLPLATRDLRITRSSLGKVAGVYGASALVADEMFSRALLPHWLDRGNTVGLPELPLLASTD